MLELVAEGGLEGCETVDDEEFDVVGLVPTGDEIESDCDEVSGEEGEVLVVEDDSARLVLELLELLDVL